MSRWRTAVVVGCLGLVAAVTAVAINQSVSPQQAAATAAPPAASVIHQRVEKKTLVDSVTGQGVVVMPSERSPVLAPSDGTRVLSAAGLPVGSAVHDGDVLAVIAGRPVLALASAQPWYRDLKVNDHGPDVAAMQQWLVRLGANGLAASGIFDRDTADALCAVYSARKFDCPNAVSGSPDPAGTILPWAEVLAIPPGPGVVLSAGAPGTAVTSGKQVVNVGVGTPVVTLALAPSDVAGMKVGSSASLTLADGTKDAGKVTKLPTAAATAETADPGATGDTTGGSASEAKASGGSDGSAIQVTPDRDIDPTLAGSDIAVTVVRASTDGPVTAVPTVAVSGRSDGSTFVIAWPSRRRVSVQTGAEADGWVQVDGVKAGDEVIIG